MTIGIAPTWAEPILSTPEYSLVNNQTGLIEASTMQALGKLEDLQLTKVRKSAYKQVREALAKSKPNKDQVKHLFTPNVNKRSAKAVIKRFPKLAGFFKDAGVVTDYTIVWTGDADKPILANFLCEKIQLCDGKTADEYCSMGETVKLWVSCELGFGIGFMRPALHGYTHLVQHAITKGTHTPQWFGEGTASYFESHFATFYSFGKKYSFIAFDSIASSNQGLIQMLYESQSLVKFQIPATEQNVIDALKASNNYRVGTGWERAQLSYYLGFLATEVLISSYGFKVFKDFWKNQSSKDFDTAFFEAFEITPENFYVKFAPYAFKRLKLESPYR